MKMQTAIRDVYVDVLGLDKDRYHDRTFTRDYAKKKKAKRRQQRQARRKR